MKFCDYYDVRNWLESYIPHAYSKNNLGLERIKYLLEFLGNPQEKFKSILVGGTSGKGSTAFYIAQLLQFAGPVTTFPPISARPSQKSIVDQKDNVELCAVGSSSSRATRKFDSSLKIGLHISPHLVDIRERMQIFQTSDPVSKGSNETGSSLMPMKRFIRLMSEIRLVVEKIQKTKPDLTPSYFEILVASSFWYFVKEKVDFAVVEVGLGGRLDATNILDPQICVITNVGLDHTEILGSSIEKIAYEKAGIIKKSKVKSSPRFAGEAGQKSKVAELKARPFGLETSRSKVWPFSGVPVVTGASGKALKVIEKVAKSKNAPLININTLLGKNKAKPDIFRYINRYYYSFRPQDNSFASSNFLLALTTVLALSFKPSRQDALKASKLGLPGRFEEIDSGVVLDGAHNVDKIRFLVDLIKDSSLITPAKGEARQRRHHSSLTLVVAFKKGKDWKKILDLLIKNLPVKKVIATKFYAVTDTGPAPDSDGVNLFAAVEPSEIAEYLKSKWKVPAKGGSASGGKVESFEISQEAVFDALRFAQGKQFNLNANLLDANQLVIVTGSLYLVGEVRTLWKLPEF